MLSCRKTSQLISEGLDHALPLHKRFLIHLHLRLCVTCGYYRQQITALKKIFLNYPDTDEALPKQGLPSGVRRELEVLIRQNS